jgi:HPt (histidine-containing phosphotransfer) domain-containing protein
VEKEGVVVMWMAVAQGPGLALGLARVVRVVVLAHAVEAAAKVVGVARLVETEMVVEQARAQAQARIVMESVVVALLA